MNNKTSSQSTNELSPHSIDAHRVPLHKDAVLVKIGSAQAVLRIYGLVRTIRIYEYGGSQH